MIASSLIALAMILAPPGADTQDWQEYVSTDGNFVVDFPGTPTKTFSRTAKSREGPVKVVIAQCDTPDVLYMVWKIGVPRAMGLKSDEADAVLDYWRDDAASQFNGRVITQKKLRLAGTNGKDFTIEGRPEPNAGLSMIRVREFLGHKAIYMVIAVTAPDRDLPEDVGRFFASFTIGTSRVQKSGPRPEPKGKRMGNWGVAIDPDNDCKIQEKNKGLEIDVPGTLHDLNADIDKLNAPRVLREVTGDFVLTAKVVGEFQPGPQPTNPKSFPVNAGGIFLWQDSDNYIFLGRVGMMRNNKVSTFAAFEEREWGARAALNNRGIERGDVYVRLERRGSRLLGFTSKDGQNWIRLDPMDITYPARLKVGLYAINSSNEPLTVRFEEVKLTGSNSATKAKKKR